MQQIRKVKLCALIAVMAASVVAHAQSSGRAIGWGDNSFGQLNVPGHNDDFIRVAAGTFHSVGLKSDGSIVAWGDNTFGQCNVPQPNTGFIDVSTGTFFNLALRSNGSIVGWGLGDYGSSDVPGGVGYVQIAAGAHHCLALTWAGNIVAWGRNDYGQCNVPDNSGYIAIAAGRHHSVGLKANGTIRAWGRNQHGQCNVPAHLQFTSDVAAGERHSVGVMTDDDQSVAWAVGWGANEYGQGSAAPWHSTQYAIKCDSGYEHNLALQCDGSIVAWGYNQFGQCDVPSPNSGFLDIAAGANHSVAIRPNPPLLPGDLNCDGVVNFADISPFIAALKAGGPDNWPGDCPYLNGDTNGDGLVNFADISGLIALIKAGSAP